MASGATQVNDWQTVQHPDVSDWQTVGAPQQDAFQKAVNYRTGNNLIDAPMGVVQGIVKGMAGLGEDIGAASRFVMGKPQASPQQVDLDTKPNGVGQGTGKFLEQTAEYALPAGEVAKATKGASLLVRAGAQAGVGAAVSAVQSHGDPTATVAGGVLGAAGEVVPAAVQGVKRLAGAKVPNIQNFSDAFGAVPTQKPAITKALPILLKDGITPEGGPPEMQSAIKNKLNDLGKAYESLPGDLGEREVDAKTVIDRLKAEQAQYAHGAEAVSREVTSPLADQFGRPITSTQTSTQPIVSNANQQYYKQLEGEISDINKLASARGGKVTFDDLRYMRDGANGRTNFNSPDADQNLYRAVGNVYRSAMDQIAPETTQLNRDYATYKQLESIADKNVAMGRGGITKSGLQTVMDKAAASPVGASLGYTAGHAIAGPVGGAVGATAGAILYPKLAGPVRQAIQNTVDSGAFSKLTPALQFSIKKAATIGDSAAVMKFLQRAPLTAAQTAMAQ